jgi:hypothetical protein
MHKGFADRDQAALAVRAVAVVHDYDIESYDEDRRHDGEHGQYATYEVDREEDVR